MARPTKNNCEYFPHDNDMRNHPKVKAIRSKFANGYAIWSMLLEYLTGADGNVLENTDIQYELLSGDFGVSVTEIRDVVNYAILLEMLFEKNGFINSESLDERLEPVYKKRGKAKQQSAKQKRVNGKYATETTVQPVVSVTEMPQSKVNRIKEDNIESAPVFNFKRSLLDTGVSLEVAEAWMKVRKAKKAVNTEIAFNAIRTQLEKAILPPDECIRIAVERSWSGFKAEWVSNIQPQQNRVMPTLNPMLEKWDGRTRWYGTQRIPFDAPPCPSNNYRFSLKSNTWTTQQFD